MRIGPGDAPRRLGYNCGGALAVSEAEKVRSFREVSRSQNTLGIQAMVTILILRDFRALALPARSFNYLPHSLKRSSIRMENPTFSSEASAKPRGAFIVVEGLDRSGKSTQCAKLRSFLESSGHLTELWRSLMEEKLKGGTTLIVDSYSYSGVAFSSAKVLGIEWCKAPEVGLLAPDSVLYLDIYHLRELLREVDMEMRVCDFERTIIST
ncbi:hypothetical protein Bca52824_064291 [Brassica carinata]|uniref:Thymidylate kinase-like domain-containing protein n=1 Tax=Brassica carinata TaxID=52824 RepID=A0A8X7UB82_BRACI|nr:hypothetical protein Bca52824_064291 [Brassica carinata]